MGKVSVVTSTVNSENISLLKRNLISDSLKESGDEESVLGAAQFPQPVYQVVDGIKHIIHSDKPAAITLGHNKEYQTKSQLSFVAGTLGSLITENDPTTGNPVEVAYPTPTDAAQLIVSEMTDFGDYNARSLVSAKADAIGLRAAEIIELRVGGIPFLANGHQTTNKYGGIHLIAGNRTEGKDFDLQHMVKGENLEEMMVDLIETIQNLVSQVTVLNNDVKSLKTDLISHNHTVSLVGSVTATSPVGPVAGTANVFGATGTSLGLASSLPATIAKNNALVTTNLSGIDGNFTIMRQNYLEQTAPLPIKSRFNKVN
tara:strand:+ start:1533 stop:2477 length:945 start_codon:yes stop_codon:yes gene_type:complete